MVVKAKQEVRANPCLLSSSNSRPHLSTYVDLIKGRKGIGVGTGGAGQAMA